MAHQKVEYYYLQKIIEFNSDKDIIALREKYKEPTFFEIISKQRSETTYSSFLKWMFQSSSTDLGTVSPILLLLDVLVSQDNKGLIDDAFKRDIITRNIKINNIEVETEKSVSVLASELSSNGIKDLAELNKDEIKNIIAKCQDRIDIFICCNIELGGETKKLQIIIENKIDSSQGGYKDTNKIGVDKYINASQTDRYYIATANKEDESLYQLYVYLLPKTSDFTKERIASNINVLRSKFEKETGQTKKGKLENQLIQLEQLQVNENFIEIYYQDIVDGIVSPMLASSTLSTRERFFLEELKTELTFPSLESNNVRNSIANSDEYAVKFSDLWIEYKKLIIDAAIATSESEIWWIDDNYYNYQPKVELISKCLDVNESKVKEQDWINEGSENEKCKERLKRDKSIYYFNRSCWYSKLEIIANELKVKTGSTKSFDSIIGANNTINELLKSFWDSNKRFLLAFMNGLKEEDHNKIKCLTEEVSKRDTTKYKIYFGEECLNDLWLDKKPANNAETAWLIIKAWAEKVKGGNVSITDLRDMFTSENSNTYYKSGKWLKHLFYDFSPEGNYKADGDENDGVQIQAGGWDFYDAAKNGDERFLIDTKDSKKVIMLKMWRKDGLQKLIKLVTDSKYFKEGTLTIQPDK